jgi:hypothetical protein
LLEKTSDKEEADFGSLKGALNFKASTPMGSEHQF